MALVNEDYPAACMIQQTVLNPNQFRYQVDGYAQRFRTEGLSHPISSDGKTTSSDKVTESLRKPGRAENGLSAISVGATSSILEGLGQAVSPNPLSESLNGSSQHAPSPETGESAGTRSPAGSDIMIPKLPGPTSLDALDEAIEEVAAFKDLVWNIHPYVTIRVNTALSRSTLMKTWSLRKPCSMKPVTNIAKMKGQRRGRKEGRSAKISRGSRISVACTNMMGKIRFKTPIHER